VSPECDSAPAVASGTRREERWDKEQGEILPMADVDRKRLAGLQSRLALRGGWIVSRDPTGVINVSRWGLARTLDTLDELEALACAVGA
jgi:hypothetical protein